MAPDTGIVDSETSVEAGGEVAPCREADDFYTPQARDSIGRFCERFFNDNVLTPTELLHSARHQTTLSNQALFVGILQNAERTLNHKPGTLNQLVNEVARLTRQRAKDWPVPDLTADTYADTVTQVLARNAAFAGAYIVDAALAQLIQTARTFAEKVQALLDLVASTSDEEALAPVDRLLSEMVRLESGMASLAGNLDFAERVETLVTLVAGDMTLPEQAPALLRGLETLLRRAPMPLLCDGLLIAFRRELGRPDRLTTVSKGDLLGVETVQKEALALGALGQRLRSGDGFLGGERTEMALQRRLSLLVNEDSVPELVRGQTFLQKLRTLFLIQRMPLAPSSERAVNLYLKSFFDSRDLAGRLLDCWKEPNDKLRGIAEVQKLVRDSCYSEDEREGLSQQLDEIQAAFIRTQRMLNPFVKGDPTPEQVLDLLKLAGEGAFCHGKSRTAVARVLLRHVHRPRFMRAFLLSAATPKERAPRVAWLRTVLAVVAVPFIDLTALHVLVVDDESGPRGFVKSVLSDLGVTNIDSAADGAAALDRFTQCDGAYDLIICDWMMPKVSGLDVLRTVRASRPDIPFLMVTALATRAAVEKALAHHVSGYIAKPFTPDQLEEKVLHVLTQRHTASV